MNDNLTNEQIREQLRKIISDYRTSRIILTPSVIKEFEQKAQPLLNKLNQRMENLWMTHGGLAVGRGPVKFTFKKILANGI